MKKIKARSFSLESDAINQFAKGKKMIKLHKASRQVNKHTAVGNCLLGVMCPSGYHACIGNYNELLLSAAYISYTS